jgi:anhydro-N-acetylmuramic acid kinase
LKETILPLISYKIPIADKLNSFTKHIAIQIAASLPSKKGKLLVTGGGAYNDFLIEMIQEQLRNGNNYSNYKTLEFKEALIFGLLGVLKLRGEINVLVA